MSLPGAAKSGFRNELSPFGPRELNEEITSVLALSMIDEVMPIVAIPSPPASSSASKIASPSACTMDTLGKVTSGRLIMIVPGSLFHRIIATAPAA